MVQDRGGDESGEHRRLRARERVLREAVADLTAEVRDLQRQLATLAEAQERLRAGFAPEVSTAAPAAAPPPSPGAATAALRRAVKAAIRGSLGVVRRVWGAADPAQRWVVAPRHAAAPVAGFPTLTMITDGAPAVDRAALLGELARQTASGVEVVFWDRATASAELHLGGARPRSAPAGRAEELLAAVSGEYLLELPATARGLPTTLLEVLQWLVASEQLPFVRVFTRPVDGDVVSDQAEGLLLCARSLWRPGGLDLVGLAALARARPVVGKTVGLAGRLDAAVPRLAPLGPDSRTVVCRTGRYDVWAGNRAGPAEHLVRPLSPDGAVPDGGRPAVMVVLSSPLTGGSAEALAAIIRELGSRCRFVIAALSADHGLGVSRALAMERLGATVYELGTSLDPEIQASAVERIAASCRPVSVLAVGRDPRLNAVTAGLRDRTVRLVGMAGDGGVIEGAEPTLTAAGPSPTLWIGGSGPTGQERITAVRRDRVRDELGAGADRWLVMAVTDLVPSGRPEDVVAVANRLRDQPDMVFVIVGDGPLAETVVDLATFLDVRALRLRRRTHDLWELVAAADLVLDPSEETALRPSVAAALAVGTPVVTAPGGGADELVGELGGGIVVRSVGDAEALAGAVRAVRDCGHRPDPVRARELLAARSGEARQAVARALLTEPLASTQG